ncbi:MAG: alpha/beta hydrolase [Cyanophyceae cyanobacterium]
MSYLLRILLTVVGGGAIAYAALCTFMVVRQRQLIFLPVSALEQTPDALGIPYEEVWLPVTPEHSERIHGWWLANASTADVLLYLHGNSSNISVNLSQAQRYYQLGFSVLLIDYRGFGLSEGRFPSETQVYQDAQAAWEYLVQKRHIEPHRIFLYGHSLGGAIAIDLATRHPEAAGLIVEGTFTSMRDMAKYRRRFEWLPVNLLLTQRFDSIHKIKSLQTPLLLIHGSDDLVVPMHMSQDLYAAATGTKTLFIVPGAGHNNAASVGAAQYLQTVREFYLSLRDGERGKGKLSLCDGQRTQERGIG